VVHPRVDRQITSFCAAHIATHHLGEITMSDALCTWILIGSNAYDEYTFVPWLNKNVYRRTVDLSAVCIQ
jgi:hypothetical protein